MSTLRWTETSPTDRILTMAASLAALSGTLLLCVGQGDYTLAVLVGCAVALSFCLTEWTGKLRLSPPFANLATLVVVGLAGIDFWQGGREFLLIAIANSLVYLQIILLFQEKTVRVYWHIILLSFLQVVVGAALSLSASFGVLLLAFICVAVFTLHVFFASNQLRQLNGRGRAARQANETVATRSRIPAVSAGRRWPYAGRPIELSAASLDSFTHFSVRLGRHVRTTFASLVVALPVAALVFFAVPRMGTDPWRGGAAEQQRIVGFSQEVRLGELGSAAENTEVVMRVRFVDPQTGRGLRLENAPMMRGTVVTKYEEGKWTHHGHRFETTKRDLPPPPRGANYVRQEIALEPLNEPVVFSVYPAYTSVRQPIAYDEDVEQILRQPETLQRSQLNLRIETPGLEGRQQIEITPAERDIRRNWNDFRLTLLPPTQDRRRSLSTIIDTAERALRDAGAIDADTYTVCKTLERYLQRDGGFTYTLSSPPRTPGLDPVEDFVANNRSGNCEFFASALALMLRSRGIPTRIVIGFQGGEWNSVGQFYQFRQLHAHSWVEAFLTPLELRAYVRNPRAYRQGGWLRLDPTAVTLASQQVAASGVLGSVREATEYAELVWIKYIVGMTGRRQQEALYRPVAAGVRRLVRPMSPWMATMSSWFVGARDWLNGNWFSWRGGVAAMFLSLVIVSVYRCVRALTRWLQRSRTRHARNIGPRGPAVPFYRHFEQMLALMGITRAAEQTQREFAMSVAGHLAESPATSAYAAVPRRVVDAFYRVRFGRSALSTSEDQEIEAALATLQRALEKRRGSIS